MKYRRKPVEVEAMQYTHNSRTALIEWVIENNGSIISTGIDEEGARYELENIKIQTREGAMMARLGDWVIMEPFPIDDRRFYPCKPEIFEESYEAVE